MLFFTGTYVHWHCGGAPSGKMVKGAVERVRDPEASWSCFSLQTNNHFFDMVVAGGGANATARAMYRDKGVKWGEWSGRGWGHPSMCSY